MTLRVTPDNLKSEVEAAVKFREEYSKETRKLVQRYTGRFYRRGREPDEPVVSNHAYEFLSVLLPAVAFDNPRCRCTALDPNISDGYSTMGDRAAAIGAALNQWSSDDEISQQLGDAAVDFFFSWAVFMITTADKPGTKGFEMVPQKPYLMHLMNHHFSLDPEAKTNNPLSHDGPRHMEHMWRADVDDLMEDDLYNSDVVRDLAEETDLTEYNEGVSRGPGNPLDIPDRHEVLVWDVWVPEIQTPSADGEYDPAVNGTIFSLARGHHPGGMTKKAEFIRDPRPAYCPPWGPYVIAGAYKVPGSPYPLGPLVATAEEAERVNAHEASAALDAANHKNFAYGKSATNAGDANRIKQIRHGDIALLDDPETIGQMEIGGVTNSRYQYLEHAHESLNRRSGLSDAMRGQVMGGSTATESAIAQSGGESRKAWLTRSFRNAISKVFRSAAWYAFYGEDFHYRLSGDAQSGGVVEYRGGLYSGMDDFNFFDLGLVIDPLSIEHTSASLLQQRVTRAYEALAGSAPAMSQTPWIQWREPLRALFESLNIGEIDDWLDSSKLAQSQEEYVQLQREQQAQQQMAEQAKLKSVERRDKPADRPVKSVFPAMANARQIGQSTLAG